MKKRSAHHLLSGRILIKPPTVQAGGFSMPIKEGIMVELYFTIRTAVLIVSMVIMVAYVAYELWRWFH